MTTHDFTNDSNQAERKTIVKTDSYFSRQSHTVDDAGGRYARLTPTNVTGSTPSPQYPQLPSSSPWSGGFDQNVEPVLGFAVDEMPQPAPIPQVAASPTTEVDRSGVVSGIDCIDIDPDGLAWLEANRYRLPLTREHQTPRGIHLLLNHHPGLRNSSHRIAPGVDVRGDGGYIIWWVREGYPVIDLPLADWPEWLLELTNVVDVPFATLQGSTHTCPSHANAEIERTGSVKLRSRYILQKVERAKVGERNRLLFWGSCRHGEIIGEGRMKREVAEALLEGTAKFNGLWCDGVTPEEQADAPRRVRATIRSGIETGIKQWQAMMGDKASMQGQHLHVQPSSVGAETKVAKR